MKIQNPKLKIIFFFICLCSVLCVLYSVHAAAYKIYGAASLAGGGTGALDKIDGAGLVAGDGAVVITSTNTYFYTLKASGCGAESSPDTIIPDINPGAKCWIRVIAPNLEDFNLDSLKNVAAMTEVEGQIFYYDATTSNWKNTSLLSIDDVNSKVGIKTTSPNAELDVNGRIATSGVGVTPLSGPMFSMLYSGEGNLVAYDYTAGTYQPILYGGSIHRWTIGATEKMRIDSSGNVGIGTATPSAKLEINNTSASDVGLIVKGAASQSANLLELKDSSGNVVLNITEEDSNDAMIGFHQGEEDQLIIRNNVTNRPSFLSLTPNGSPTTNNIVSYALYGQDYTTDPLNFDYAQFTRKYSNPRYQIETKTSGSATALPLNIYTTSSKIGLNKDTNAITASVHFKGGVATASGAPLKIDSGSNLTIPEAGTIEYNGSWYITDADLRRPIGTLVYNAFRKMPFYANDFLLGANATQEPFVLTAISSGTFGTITGVANHVGIVRISSATGANSGGRLASAASPILIIGGEFFEAVMQFKDVSSEATVRIGFCDSTTSADCIDGAYIELSSGTLKGKTASNSSTSTTGTTYTLSASTWYRLRVIVNSNASRVDYYIYNDSGTELWTNNLTTTIPTTTGMETGLNIIATDLNTDISANEIIHVDYAGAGFGQKDGGLIR